MKIKLDASSMAIAGALVAGLPATAFAQVIVYAPAAATPVPTLSQWGMLILAVMLAMAAVYMGRKSGNRLLSGLLVVAALGLGVQGAPVGNVQAIPAPTMANSTGGTVDLSELGGLLIDVPVNGHPSIPMQIINVTPPSSPTSSTPTCAAGLIVQPGQTCFYSENPV